MLIKYLQVFIISMLPIIELRGAIPFAAAIGVPPLTAYGISIVGNMLPIPFIFLFAGKILHWGKDKPYIGKIFTFFLEKGYKAGHKLEDRAGFGLYLALTLFVGIPLPGTGAWYQYQKGNCCCTFRSLAGRNNYDGSKPWSLVISKLTAYTSFVV